MMPGKMLNSRFSILGLNMNPDSPMPLALSQMDIELLDKESNKCKKEETMEYLLHLSREPLYLLHRVWPLPIGLGGQYAQSVKQGQEERVLTRFEFWTHTPLHLAVYTCNKISPPYVSHNKYKIGFRARNGQFKSILNPHFFEEMKFAQFEELDPIYFQTLRETMGDEAELGDDSQADDEEVQEIGRASCRERV